MPSPKKKKKPAPKLKAVDRDAYRGEQLTAKLNKLAASAPPLAAAPSGAPTWTTTRVKLGALMAWPRNPRRISDQAAARLVESFEEFGQVELLALGPNNEVYNGHQRLKTLLAKHGPEYEVEARVCSRALTEKEREKLTIYLHKGAAGEFDLELLLAEFNPDELNEWGMPDLNVPDDAEKEWQGMPEFDGNPKQYAQVVVRFIDEAAMQAFAKLIDQQVEKGTVSIWFPPEQRNDLEGRQWQERKPA